MDARNEHAKRTAAIWMVLRHNLRPKEHCGIEVDVVIPGLPQTPTLSPRRTDESTFPKHHGEEYRYCRTVDVEAAVRLRPVEAA